MNKLWHAAKWVIMTVLGSALFALGFAVFLQPNGMNSGGISGLAMVLVHLLGVGSVGVVSAAGAGGAGRTRVRASAPAARGPLLILYLFPPKKKSTSASFFVPFLHPSH